jgi:hypothetical protein
MVTRYPEKGMITSEGSGIQALSIAIRITIPRYPVEEIVSIINMLIMVRIELIITEWYITV